MLQKILYTLLIIVVLVILFPFSYMTESRIIYATILFVGLISLIISFILIIKIKNHKLFWIFVVLLTTPAFIYTVSRFSDWLDRIDYGMVGDPKLTEFELTYFRQIYFSSLLPFFLIIIYYIWFGMPRLTYKSG